MIHIILSYDVKQQLKRGKLCWMHLWVFTTRLQLRNTSPNWVKYFFILTKIKCSDQFISVVYSISCSSCRQKDRSKTELDNTKQTSHIGKTAFISHTYNEGHKFNFQETTILDYENNNYCRNICEMIHITLNKIVNYKEGVKRLRTIYKFYNTKPWYRGNSLKRTGSQM